MTVLSKADADVGREARRLLARLEPSQRSYSHPRLRRPAAFSRALWLMFGAGFLVGVAASAIVCRLIFLQTGAGQ